MTVQGVGTDECITLDTIKARAARLSVEGDGELLSISLDSNHLRVLAKLAEAAADELDARAVAP